MSEVSKKKRPHPTPLPHAGEGSANEVRAGEGEFYRPFKKKPITIARRLRRDMTDVERKLWACLRARQFEQLKFQRQYPIGRYVVDFICVEKRLIIELDGGQHAERKDYDQYRDEWLAMNKYRIVRFWNHEIIENLDGVIETIQAALKP